MCPLTDQGRDRIKNYRGKMKGNTKIKIDERLSRLRTFGGQSLSQLVVSLKGRSMDMDPVSALTVGGY